MRDTIRQETSVEQQYRESILQLLEMIHNPHFLRQVWTILYRHVERKGGAV